MDLKKYIAQKTAFVDARLDAEMPGENIEPTLLHRAMRYAVFPAGKRLRPVVCMAAAEAVGANGENAILPAMAVELFHSYTLIHDDLPCMDDDDTRRGKPTCHVEFGEANAVLAGDALQALAFELLAGHRPPACAAAMAVLLAHAAGSLGVAGGQVKDLALGDDPPTPETIDYIHLHKTADLFRAATAMGAMAGGADDAQVDALSRYGTNLGLAFQVTDDLLDLPASGVPDKTDGASYLLVHDTDTARARARSLADEALATLDSFTGTGRDALAAIVEFVVEREH